MGTSTRSRKSRARTKISRASVRKQTHRVNVPRASQRPVERTGQHRRGKRKP